MLTTEPNERGRGAGLVQRVYKVRSLGYVMGLLPFFLLLRSQHAPLWLGGSVFAICLVWPHAAYLRARHAAEPLARERTNLLCDAALGGWLVTAIHFEPIGTIVILLMFALDNMAIGGWRLFLSGVIASIGGLLVGMAFNGGPMHPFHVDPLIAMAWVPVAVVYPLTLAKTTFDTSAKLVERSRRLRELSEHDSLTGLANRASLANTLQAIVAKADPARERIAVLFIDLDGFKTVNDALGHSIGDQLLIEVAARLAACAPEGDVVARYGGDEFIIVARGRGDHGSETWRRLPDAVLATVAAPISVGGHDLPVGASIGISVFPSDGRDAATLIRAADMAMYAAKNHGRNCYWFYRAKMRVEADARLRLSARLRHAIDACALCLHYQPQVDMRTGELLGLEALVRWHDAELGEISPTDFVAVAEGSGLVSRLGEWVLGEACRQGAQWRRMGVKLPRISVNVSPLQLQRANVVETFGKILRDAGMEPACVELEVTETALMRQPDIAAHRLGEFRRAGISIAIDDFGMGYSSLGQLRTLPVDRIKIDRAFVHGIGNGDTGAIATAIITLSKTLGLNVIAEGVETLAQREFLLALGCVDAQGFLYSKPLDVAGATRLLLEGGPLPRQSHTAARGVGRLAV